MAFTSDGTPNNLHVVRSMRGAIGRRIAIGAGARAELRALEDEYEALLRAWCGWLAGHGHSELALYTSAGSPNYDIVRTLASQTDAYDLRLDAPEPADIAERGVYVDAVYF